MRKHGPKPEITTTEMLSTFYREMVSDCQDSFALLGYTSQFAHDDRRYLYRRLSAEGSTFAMTVMPLLGRALNSALCSGRLSVPTPYFSSNTETGLPRLFHTIWALVFSTSGVLRPDADKTAIRFLRQVTLAWSKVVTEASDLLVEESVKDFVKRTNDHDAVTNICYDSAAANTILIQASREVDMLMAGWDVTGPHLPTDPVARVNNTGDYGRHGPGAVAEVVPGGDKWRFIRGSDDGVMRCGSYSIYGTKSHKSSTSSRLIAVPKDERGPRLIAAEPTSSMFRQQGLARALMHYIERESPARGRINFTDQSVNASRSKETRYATLDLKDASDRIHVEHIKLLFMDCPILLARLLDLRSQFCRLPSGELHKPACFATMGNALCFPVESIVFYCVVRAILRLAGDTRCDLFVYGDDIIVERKYAELVIESLELIGFKTNPTKCCYKTPFRESCGAEWYAGQPVCITRPKTLQVQGPLDVARWISYINGFITRGYVRTGFAISDLISKKYYVPRGNSPLAVPCDGTPENVTRWNRTLQRKEIKTYCVTERRPRCEVPDEYRLYAYFSGASFQSAITADPNGRIPRQNLRVRYGWVPVL